MNSARLVCVLLRVEAMGYTHNNLKKVMIPLIEKLECDRYSTVTGRRFFCKWFMYQVHLKATHVNVDDNYHT